MRAGRNAGGSAPVRIVRSCAWRLLAPRGRFVRTVERSANRDELETVGAGDRQACGCGIDANEAAGVEVDLLAVGAHLLVTRAARRQFHEFHVPRRFAVRVVVRLRLPELVQALLRLPPEKPHHIRKTPNVVSGMAALRADERPSARTCLVSSGSMMPSSHNLAVE